ncbi:MAG TPA: 6,7-dimethyl-8-ribityllumazine synthase [Terriglobales bacterium]|nr:6,7-dimethyl-8-ribityllumazine synthase [Terriglobales bacterium]
MIKSIHKLLVAKREADFHALADFFDALGLAPGESWKGRRSQGIKLDAPEAGVEIGMGRGFPEADLVVECDSADVLYEIAKRRGFKIAQEIADHDWGARMFSLELPASAGRLAIFSYNQDWRPKPQLGEGRLDASGKRFGIVVSRFNAFITERLLAGALDALRRAGARSQDIQVVRVPGAFEVPSAARALAKSGKVGALICLACIIRGETSHYEHLADEVTRGIGQSAQETGVPHAYGVLTCDSLEQAIDRAGLKMGNKGWDAALSAVEMAGLRGVVGRTPGSKKRRAGLKRRR